VDSGYPQDSDIQEEEAVDKFDENMLEEEVALHRLLDCTSEGCKLAWGLDLHRLAESKLDYSNS
jgi:hypothetical protein